MQTKLVKITFWHPDQQLNNISYNFKNNLKMSRFPLATKIIDPETNNMLKQYTIGTYCVLRI